MHPTLVDDAPPRAGRLRRILGTISATGGITTRSLGPSGSPAGAGTDFDAAGLQTYDANGVLRVSIGDVGGAEGYGGAVYDPNGNLLWDTLGLITAASIVATGSNTSSSQTSVGTTPSTLSGASFTFTVPGFRNQTILLIAGFSFYGNSSANTGVSLSCGGSTTTYAYSGFNGTVGMVAASKLLALTLAPGTYTATLQGYASATTTITLADWEMTVLRFGS